MRQPVGVVGRTVIVAEGGYITVRTDNLTYAQFCRGRMGLEVLEWTFPPPPEKKQTHSRNVSGREYYAVFRASVYEREVSLQKKQHRPKDREWSDTPAWRRDEPVDPLAALAAESVPEVLGLPDPASPVPTSESDEEELLG